MSKCLHGKRSKYTMLLQQCHYTHFHKRLNDTALGLQGYYLHGGFNLNAKHVHTDVDINVK